MAQDPIRVIVVDDHPGVRAGLRSLLERTPNVNVVGEAVDGPGALHLADTTPHDIILLDVELPSLRGDEVAKHILDRHPESKILAVSSYDDPQYIWNMLGQGAAGYITKDEVPTLLIDAIRGVAAGETGWVSRRVVRQTGPLEQNISTFTVRERQILSLLSQDLPFAQIAEQLELSEARLMSFISILERKLGVKGHPGLAEAARSIPGAHDT